MRHLVKSIPAKGKTKNGDNFNFYEDKNIIIASVADGVGGNACDWKASEQICQDLEYFYLNEYRNLGVKEGIAHSLMKSYARIYWTKGACEGMLTTLVSVIIDKQKNCYYYFGIGDSLILKFENNEIEDLTPECPFRMQTDLLPAQVKDGGELRPGISFALMSDGVSENRKRFRQELDLVNHADDWEGKFEQMMQLNQLTQFDDMTLMLLRG